MLILLQESGEIFCDLFCGQICGQICGQCAVKFVVNPVVNFVNILSSFVGRSHFNMKINLLKYSDL